MNTFSLKEKHAEIGKVWPAEISIRKLLPCRLQYCRLLLFYPSFELGVLRKLYITYIYKIVVLVLLYSHLFPDKGTYSLF